MTVASALAEQHAAHLERQKRLGMHRPNVIRMDLVRPAPEPVVPAPQMVIPAVPEGRDWINVASPNLYPVSSRIVISVVASSYDVTPIEIVSRRRTSEVFMPRAVVCWILRHHAHLSLPQIGIKVGGRDHTTVRNAVMKVDALRQRSHELADRIDELVAIARSKDDRWRAAA